MASTHTIRLMVKKGAVLPGGNVTIHSGDTLLWDNQTDRARALIFSVWPFVEVPESISVPNRNVNQGKSKSFVVAKLETPRTFPYTIEPTINPDDGPPDEPGLSIEP